MYSANGPIDAQQEIRVNFVDEIFRIETKTQPGGPDSDPLSGGVARMKKPDCDWCKDNPRRKCKHCACCVCGGKESPEKQILCDECNMAYHLWCLAPKLETVPEEDWSVDYVLSCLHYSSGYEPNSTTHPHPLPKNRGTPTLMGLSHLVQTQPHP